MQIVKDIEIHQLWYYVKSINECINEVPKSKPDTGNRKWPAARTPQPVPRKTATPYFYSESTF